MDSGPLGGKFHSKNYSIRMNWESNLKNPYSTAPCLSSSFIIQRKLSEINRKKKHKLAQEMVNTNSESLSVQSREDNY